MSVLSHRLLVQLVGRCHLAAVRSAVATRAQISMASKSSKFYAVRSGSTPGIYRSWAECELQARGGGLWRARVCFDGSERVAFTQVKGFAGARHKSFTSLAAAEAFLRGESGAGGALGGAQGAGKRKRSRSPRPATHRGAHSCAAPLDADTWRLQFDGGARCVRSPLSTASPTALSLLPSRSGNPGPSGAGAVLLSPEGSTALAEVSQWLGHGTNNEAEYRALISGLHLARSIPSVRRLLVEGGASCQCSPGWWILTRACADSTLVTRQMRGEWKCEAPGLVPLVAEARAAAAHFDFCEYRYIPREFNSAVRTPHAQCHRRHC